MNFDPRDVDYYPHGEPWPGPPARAFSAASFKGLKVPERRWIVPNYIPDETPTMLSGDGGIGKSWITLQLAAARQLALDWLGLLANAKDQKHRIRTAVNQTP